MGSHGTFADWSDWKDRVAGMDEALDEAGFEHVEVFVNDALELAQQVIEAAIEPIIDVATELRASRAGAWWQGSARRARRSRNWRHSSNASNAWNDG